MAVLSLVWSDDSTSCMYIVCTCCFETDSSVPFFYAGIVLATKEAVNTGMHVDFIFKTVGCYLSKDPLHDVEQAALGI